MASAVQNQYWLALSQELASVINRVSGSIVAVQGGRRLTGSGIHWRSGLIVTSSHMLRRDDQLSIKLHGQGTLPAALIGRDPSTDIAVLKIEALESLPVVETTSAEGLKVGNVVIAVGRSHLGDLAASAGIVARLGGEWRTWRGGQIDRLIRPDIKLYPGQAGSALVTAEGRVLGMNSDVLARMSAITVPAATVNRVISELLEHGHIRRPYLGLAMQNVPIPEAVRTKLKLEIETGLLVMQLEPGGPGSQAGVMLGDVIVGIQGKAAGDLTTLSEALSTLRPGNPAKLTLIRGGEKTEVSVTVGDRATRK